MQSSRIGIVFFSAVAMAMGQTADLGLIKTVDNPEPDFGDVITFTIKLTNSGPDEATGIEVTDPLPAGLTLISVTQTIGTYNSTSGVWAVGALAAQTCSVLTIQAGVAPPVALEQTVPPPFPQEFGRHGMALANVGSNHFISGVQDGKVGPTFSAGRADLYTVDGTFVLSVSNPTPGASDGFGASVAGLGEDLFLVGAQNDDVGFTILNNGAVYLYDTNGTLHLSITNPTMEAFAFFGWAIAGITPDRFAVSAPGEDLPGTNNAGIVYIYSTNGTMITAITNKPIATGFFGRSLAPVGNGNFLVGAIFANGGAATFTGAAFLYDQDGNRLGTYTNPAPGSSDFFGTVVRSLSTNTFVVSAPSDDPGGIVDAGSVYVYDTDGTLRAEIPSPAPAVTQDKFADSLAAVGTDRFVAGVLGKDPDGVSGSGQ
ncbi:MAG: hypothetical protein AAF492_10395, partial [Verrucomicrobiota bacterium]